MATANLRLNDPVRTPHGPATFIGFHGGNRVQVSRWVKASELSREECEARKVAVAEMSNDEFREWQKSAKFCVNLIVPLAELNGV
jgi:hypothetical protein